MQKLAERNTYTPTDVPQVRSNRGLPLNSPEGRGGVVGLRTSANNLDAALTARGHAGQDLIVLVVYVLNKKGNPLMSCSPRKARVLLKENKAKVVKRTPFTIQLTVATGGTTQPITLGIDSGYKHVGLSAVTDKQEVYSVDVNLRTDIVKLNLERRQYRRGRRSRKTWYRKPRFLNRKKDKGWLAPSIQHKLDSYLKLIAQVRQLLPVTKVIVEVATFNTQKMQNPEIKGIEYQQGELQGYEVREYLLEKWGRKCAYCGKSNIPLEIEHIIPNSRGGSDRVCNLTMSCTKCNQKKGNKTAKEFGYPNIQKQAQKSLMEAAFMNIVRWKLVNYLKCAWTYGYITKYKRAKLGLEKSHTNDAFVIADGIAQQRTTEYLICQVRKCNRKLFKGIRSHIKNTAERFVYGFQRFDKVSWKGIECFVFGRRKTGYFALRKLDGAKIHSNAKAQELNLLESARTLLIERRVRLLPSFRKESPPHNFR